MLGLEGKKLAVAALIGGGKTTFVDNATKQLSSQFKVLSEAEFVPATLLKRYCEEPIENNARDFQSHMHAHAAIRDRNAHRFTHAPGKKGRVALVERTLSENLVFFEANVRMGRLTESYRPNYEAMWEDYRQFAPDLIIYLHVSNEHAVQRMYRRSEVKHERECEREYVVDDYFKVLGEEYFNFVVRHSRGDREPPVMVVNWDKHVDMEHPTAYDDAVAAVLQKANDYFLGTYRLPNFTISHPMHLNTSTGEVNFDSSIPKSEILFRLARGEDVQF